MNFEVLQELGPWMALVVLLVVIAIDTILGISIAITRKELKVYVEKLPQFLVTNVLPYFVPLLAIAGFQEFMRAKIALDLDTVLGPIFWPAMLLVFGRFGKGLFEKLKCLFEREGKEEEVIEERE